MWKSVKAQIKHKYLFHFQLHVQFVFIQSFLINLTESVAYCEKGWYLMDDSGEGAERTAGQGRPLHLSSQGWLGHMLFASLRCLSLDLWCHPD